MKTPSKKLFAFAAFFCLALAVHGEDVLGTIDWKQEWADVAPTGKLYNCALTNMDGRAVLKIESITRENVVIRLTSVEHPAISSEMYEFAGEIRYDNVEGAGYLEMWNYFPAAKPGGEVPRYFSRTMDEQGPMGRISGTSGWRKFILPFDRTGTTNPPARLVINLCLPGLGTVYLSTAKLVQLPDGVSGLKTGNHPAWWSNRQSALIGGWGGGIVGCWGGLIGLLAAMKKGRKFIILSLGTFAVMGVVFVIVGLVALTLQQPYAVYYPLLLGGIILGTVGSVNLYTYLRRNQQEELRRMQALDAAGV